MVKGKNIIVAKLVAGGLALIFSGFGVLGYADTVNKAWNEFWLSVLQKTAPFQIFDPMLGVWMVIAGFALIGIGYLFHKA